MRRAPIWVRLGVTIFVPLITLALVLLVQLVDARKAQSAAKSGLARAVVFRAAALLQSCIVQPEVTSYGLRNDLYTRGSAVSSLTLTTLDQMIRTSCVTAQHSLEDAIAQEPGVMTPNALAAFDAEQKALQPVLSGNVSRTALNRLASAREVADDALTDLFLESQDSVSFFVYQGVIEVQRARHRESAAVLVALSGLSKLTPAEISALSGARDNAVSRMRFGTDSDVRQQVIRLLESGIYQTYVAAGELAGQVLARRMDPPDDASVLRIGQASLALVDSLTAIADHIQEQGAAQLRSQVRQAQHRERLALGIAGVAMFSTLVLAVLALRSILRPLSDLTRRADELAAGRLNGRPVELVGRDELTKLAKALESNAATLVHVNRQAQAMAIGRLDHPSLARPAPGPFGAVLHSNVRAVQAQAARLRHDADHDPMTGLLNRAALVRAALQPVGARPGGAEPVRWLLFLDLDGFKGINDTFGHEQGDDVLRAVSERLLRAVRPGDLVSRLGGDEFAIVLTVDEAASSHEVERMVERITRAVRTPVPRRRGDGQTVQVGVSIGRAMIPSQGGNLEEVLAQADAEMYEVKRARKAARAGQQSQPA